VESGATLASYALVHLDWPHVLLNLGFLLAFGSGLERALGGLTLLVVFMLSAVAGAGLMLALDWGAPIVVIGASGGVSGLIGGVIRLLLTDPHEPARRRLGFTLLSVVVALDLVFGLLGAAALGLQGAIAWQTHLGGLLAGLLLVRRPRVDLSV
jgi:membrane associated rhomboid family serine protease